MTVSGDMGVLRTMVESIHLPFLYHSYGTTIVIGLERLCTGVQSSHFWNASGVDKDQLDLQGSTALLLASKQGHLPVVTFLLHALADPDRCRPGGTSRLHEAAFAGHWQVVAALLQFCQQFDPVDDHQTPDFA